MSIANDNKVLQDYISEIKKLSSQKSVNEASYYPCFSALLGHFLKKLTTPNEIISVATAPANSYPDFTVQEQTTKIASMYIEAKLPNVEISKILRQAQVVGYASNQGSGRVMITNFHDLALAQLDQNGSLQILQSISLETANSAASSALEALLMIACEPRSTIKDVKDVAYKVALQAKSILEKLNNEEDQQILFPIQEAFRLGLGIEIKPELLNATVAQTVAYGIFAAWLDYNQEFSFSWLDASYRLDLPVFADILHSILTPRLLRLVNLVPYMDAIARVFIWVDRDAFLQQFDSDAIQYFYEPFLANFDAALRNMLGVWYTPMEIARYQIRQVNYQLVSSLGITDGILCNEVVALDPATGTGTYLIAFLELVIDLLKNQNKNDAEIAATLKSIVLDRLVGFEILPASLIICHVHVHRFLARHGVRFGVGEKLRIYLTNSLTGWGGDVGISLELFPDLIEELNKARDAKGEKILAIFGNPPYQGYSSAESEEEKNLIQPWIAPLWGTWGVRKHRLNDLYARFWKVAINKVISSESGGVVSFITNRKWLVGASYPAMREEIVNNFPVIVIDDLHGGTDEGISGDESVFKTTVASGIKRPVAIATVVRGASGRISPSNVEYRSFTGTAVEKRQAISNLSSTNSIGKGLVALTPLPNKQSRFKLIPSNSGVGYPLDEYLTFFNSGVQPVREDAVMDAKKVNLENRMKNYFDPSMPPSKFFQSYPSFGMRRSRYDGEAVRQSLKQLVFEQKKIVRFLYRPMDTRWLYWETNGELLNRPRANLVPYWQNLPQGTRQVALVIPQTPRRRGATRAIATTAVPAMEATDPNARVFPLYTPNAQNHSPLFSSGQMTETTTVNPAWVDKILQICQLNDRKLGGEIVFFNLLAILNSPKYLNTLDVEPDGFPELSLPNDPKWLRCGELLGRSIANLYDPDITVQGIDTGKIPLRYQNIGVPDTTPLEGVEINGSKGANGGNYDPATKKVLWKSGGGWNNISEECWGFSAGGFKILSKWLSYRVGAPLTNDEIMMFHHLCRRVALLVRRQSLCDKLFIASQANPIT